MSDLFGSDALFVFDRQPSEAVKSNAEACIDLTEENAADREQTEIRIDKSTVTLPSGNVLIDRGSMKMPSDWPLVSSLSALEDRPHYATAFRDVLTVPEIEEEKPPQPKSRPKLTCFNCGGPHMISNCKEPKDYAKIAQKRREFNEANPPRTMQSPQQQQQQQQNTNYPNNDLVGNIPPMTSFDHFRAGAISNVLRQALGLYPNQLPPYVYFLRELGYPPGWLEEARVPLEPDEVSDVPLFDPKKIVEYPGYNAPTPRSVVDETRHFRVKHFESRHSADAMRKWMEALRKHHEQRRALLATRKVTDKHAATSKSGDDMELDETSNDDTPAEFAQSATMESSSLCNDNSNSSSEAADLESLEKEREKLLRLLESTLAPTDTEESVEGEQEDEAEISEANTSETEPTAEAATADGLNRTSAKLQFSQSLGVSTGTPLPALTPTTVPIREKFAAGIGCHLPFENLSESLGTFERLKRVLSGVRKRQTPASATNTIPSSPSEANQKQSSRSSLPTVSSSSNRNRGYVDFDSPNANERAGGHRPEQRDHSGGRERRDSQSQGSQSNSRSTSQRYRPY